MKQLFKEKTSKFGSLISLTAITMLFIAFWLAIPEFLSSSVGRIFAVVWAMTTIVAFVAHARRLSGERRPQSISKLQLEKREMRSRKQERMRRVMRG